jgi:hypothetical protein
MTADSSAAYIGEQQGFDVLFFSNVKGVNSKKLFLGKHKKLFISTLRGGRAAKFGIVLLEHMQNEVQFTEKFSD